MFALISMVYFHCHLIGLFSLPMHKTRHGHISKLATCILSEVDKIFILIVRSVAILDSALYADNDLLCGNVYHSHTLCNAGYSYIRIFKVCIVIVYIILTACICVYVTLIYLFKYNCQNNQCLSSLVNLTQLLLELPTVVNLTTKFKC